MDDKKLKELIFSQRPVPSQAFDLRIDQEARRLAGETPIMKKKISVLAVVVAVILSLLMFGAVAERLGINLFSMFGKHKNSLGLLAPNTILKETSITTIQSPELGDTNAYIDSAYYDGQALIVAYAIENNERYVRYVPSEDELARMVKTDYSIPLETIIMPRDSIGKLREAAETGRPFGLVHYMITSAADYVKISTGQETLPNASESISNQDGKIYTINYYLSTLPENAKEQDRLDIEIGLQKSSQYYYFDGEQTYTFTEQEILEPMKATVNRADVHAKRFIGEGTYEGIPFTADIIATAAFVQAVLTSQGEPFPALPEDAWYHLSLQDGSQHDFQQFNEPKGGTDTMVFDFLGPGEQPGHLIMYLRKVQTDKADFFTLTESK